METYERVWRTSAPRAAAGQRGDWYRIENKSNRAVIDIYGEIGAFDIPASDFVREVRALEDVNEIELHLKSRGGDVFDGLAIYNTLKDHPATVNVVVDALAASIASVIAMAGDKISIYANARMMIHEAHVVIGLMGEMDSGQLNDLAGDISKLVNRINETSDIISCIYADRTDTPAADWRAAMRAETWYTGQEAVDAGLADEVIGTKKAQPRNAVIDDSPTETQVVEDEEDETTDDEENETEEEPVNPDPLAELRAELVAREDTSTNPELEVALDRVLARAH